MDQDKIDLSSVNKTKKQFSLPRLKNPFKKQAGPARDQEGKFTTGSGGLINTKHFNWKRAAPLMVVVALVGGFFVYRSFAGTYRDCATGGSYGNYNEACLVDSDEAAVVRLYYGIFNRAPDQSGLNYWTNRLASKKVTLTEMARQFMGSSEFRNRYGTLTNQKFVEAMYPQVFGRAPDAGGLKFWVDRLNAKKVTREGMMTNFTQSSEMKRNFTVQVALALNVPLSNLATAVKTYASNEVFCQGQTARESNRDVCKVNFSSREPSVFETAKLKDTQLAAVAVPANLEPGEYLLCYDYRIEGAGSKPVTKGYLGVRPNKTNVTQVATNVTYTDTGYGGAVKASSKTLMRECSNIDISSKAQSLLLQPFDSDYQSGATGVAVVSTGGVTLLKTRGQMAFRESQNQEIYYTWETDSSLLVVSGKEIRTRQQNETYRPDTSSPQPAWRSTFNGKAGKNTIHAPIHVSYQNQQRGDASVQVKVIGKDGRSIPVTLELSNCSLSSACTNESVNSDTANLFEEGSVTSYRTLSKVNFDLDKNESITYEARVVGGNRSVSMSDIRFNLFQ